MADSDYTEDSIKSLDWVEHIRLRPGMYIGKLGDGSSPDDGIYILVKEALDNSIDEFVMGHGKQIDVSLDDHGAGLESAVRVVDDQSQVLGIGRVPALRQQLRNLVEVGRARLPKLQPGAEVHDPDASAGSAGPGLPS